MSAAGDEIERRVQERKRLIERVINEVAENNRLREQLGFAVREIHPMERQCDGPLGMLAPHPVGPVFYGVARVMGSKQRRYMLLCPECYERYLVSLED